ncbi:hypothetical protein ST47_g10162 [Ascochyta rabiei]|uniref:Uncharacterized protein n=1 Tax=Didymella rabiei TaxID=5454 RepID=A0A162W5G4_DIDRA|nr:hypothetical protein ST47_g10162 [Ascochyta rabiei]
MCSTQTIPEAGRTTKPISDSHLVFRIRRLDGRLPSGRVCNIDSWAVELPLSRYNNINAEIRPSQHESRLKDSQLNLIRALRHTAPYSPERELPETNA